MSEKEYAKTLFKVKKEYEMISSIYINEINNKKSDKFIFAEAKLTYLYQILQHDCSKEYSETNLYILTYLWNDGNLRTKKELYYTIGDGVKEVKKINSIARIIFICVLLQCFNPFIFLFALALGYWLLLIPIMIAPIIANIYKKFAYSHLKYPLDCEIDYLGLAVYEGAALLGARGAGKSLSSLSNDKN